MSFPIFLSSFIGRKNETTELISQWQAKSARLLTLTGPGGSGKTRLTAEILPSIKDTFEDNVMWVELVHPKRFEPGERERIIFDGFGIAQQSVFVTGGA